MWKAIISIALAGWAVALPQGKGPKSGGAPKSGQSTGYSESGGMLVSIAGMTSDTTGGSGPYKSVVGKVPGFARHTQYMPSSVPAGMTLPVILWGNGACFGYGNWFAKFLNEIASYGFFILASGDFNGNPLSMTSAKDMTDSIDWVYKNAGQGNYTAVDKTKIAAAGQSCGGLQAYEASLDKRVTLTALFNSGLTNSAQYGMLQQLHAPVGFFTGGSSDMASPNSARDYNALPAKIPAVKGVLPNAGHMATYGDTHGGKFGKIAALFFRWQMKGDQAAAQEFLQPSSLKNDGWNIVSKGWNQAASG